MLRLPISAMGCSQTRRQWKISCLVPLGTENSFFQSCMLEFRIWALLRNPTVKIQHGHCASSISFMSAQVKLPVKKKIHWKGFIKLLSLHSVQMYNWLRNLTLEDVFLLNYSCKDTTFWDALWVACQDDSMHQLGL